MTEREKEIAVKNGTIKRLYADLVNQKIRLRYATSDELALIRQRDEKPDEFAEYNAYVEECKAEARAELDLGGDGG